MKLHIVSLNETFIDRCAELFHKVPNVLVQKGDIRDVPREGTVFVSPANSCGFMDGGIDFVLSREMFPGCEQAVKKKIAELGQRTLIGRPYLRVGSALWILVGDEISQADGEVSSQTDLRKEQTTALISAPTMFLPHPIPHTRNVYWAMQAALVCVKKIPFKVNTLVITSMGCGVGCMDPEAAAYQIRDAWREFEGGTLPSEIEVKGENYAILESRDNAQPSNYDNREIGVAWPIGWTPVAPGSNDTQEIKQVIVSQKTFLNRASAVCYDA